MGAHRGHKPSSSIAFTPIPYTRSSPGPAGAWPMHCVLVGDSMRFPNPDTRGFTLVELAVTILVLGLLFAMGIPAIQSMSGSYQLQGATENLAAQLRMGRERAIATGQVQHFHLPSPSYGNKYFIYNHSTGYIPNRWTLPVGITYYWGGGSTSWMEMRPDGRALFSALVVLQDRRGYRDTVSIQTSGLVLTK